MKQIDLVVHCWAADLPQYGVFLRMQIAALMRWPPVTCNVRLIVCCGPSLQDKATWGAIIDGQLEQINLDRLSAVQVEEYYLPREQLFRRAIARHYWSQNSTADVLWFIDSDIVCAAGCLDAVAAQVQRTDGLCFPDRYLIHRDHQTGDACWRRAMATGDYTLDPAEFVPRRSRLAIGGLQIIGADVARQVGYLGNSKWQRPVDPAKPFACFRDDSKWRRASFTERPRAVQLPELYRLRHGTSSLTKIEP